MKKLSYLFLFLIVLTGYINAQWIQTPLSNTNVISLGLSGNNIFAGSIVGVYLSTDYGNSWSLTSLNRKCYAVAINSNYIFAGTDTGVYRTSNNGTNWTHTGLKGLSIGSLLIKGNYLLAGSIYYGVYLSTNNGTNWITTPKDSSQLTALVTNGNDIYAGTFAGVFISTNNGSKWSLTPLHQVTICVAASGNNVFAGTDVGVFFSSNNGNTWALTSFNNVYVNSVFISGNYIFSGAASCGIYLSTNNGTNWINKNQGFSFTPLVKDFLVVNNYIFAATMYKSVWRRSFSEVIGIKRTSEIIPFSYKLEQNYPNPFNPSTIIRFNLKDDRFVSLKVYDIAGKEITSLVNEKLNSGEYEIYFDGSSLSSGIYYYKLEAENFSDTKKMVLIK